MIASGAVTVVRGALLAALSLPAAAAVWAGDPGAGGPAAARTR